MTDTKPQGAGGESKRHIITVVVEDYFQHSGFSRLIRPDRWRRFENRVARNTARALDLLDEFGIKATFFALGWIAEEMPEVIRQICDRGHELASKGYYHRDIQQMTPNEFREDLIRSRQTIEKACGCKVHGHRIARGTFTTDDLWALDILAEEGFAYDSSFYPRLGLIAGEPWRRFDHVHRHNDLEIREFPLSSAGPSWFTLPVAGGNYFRQLPHGLVKSLVKRWHNRYDSPFNMYFHVWELDPDLPRIEAVGRLTRIRQYRNLDKMKSRLRDYFGTYRFVSIADYMGLKRAVPIEGEATGDDHDATPPEETAGRAQTPVIGDRPPVTVVIPVFNEELAIPYLANTLAEVRDDLNKKYDLKFLFVDDGSTDDTWGSLHRHFEADPGFAFSRHTENLGVAEAILTGIRQAETEIVCSIDCDCTYDPRQLAEMIPMLEKGVDMVTASPYHHRGDVLNVPAWRLSLSKGLSFLYRRILNNRLATYTACFRVYRREAMKDVKVRSGGFLGVAEMLCYMDLRGSRVVEYPAVLEVRMLGHSKMKVLRTILGHLKLLARFAFASRRKGLIENE